MRRYEDFRKKNAFLYKGVDPFNLKSPGAIFEGVIPDSPDNGRVYIINFGKVLNKVTIYNNSNSNLNSFTFSYAFPTHYTIQMTHHKN